jgi:hypothetical protein
MGHYQAGYSFFPLAIAVNLVHHRPVPSTQSPLPWQWSYTFTDGSQLRGTFQGTVREEIKLGKAVPTFEIQGVGLTEYLTDKGKTPLLAWQPEQFDCFEMGDNLLLMSSNDNYVGNSICLVNCPQRQWAQITHWGGRLVAEPLVLERLSLHCLARDITPSTWSVDWKFSPFLTPFFHWRFRSWPPTMGGECGPLRELQPMVSVTN